jgi:hypothetical protein
MIFQKGLYNQLLVVTLRSNLLTSSQGACRPNCQNFDTIYTLTSYIRHQHLVQKRPTSVFFGDIELDFPSVFRQLLLLRLRDLQVPSPLCQHLRVLHNNLQYHIHHSFVPPSSFINIVKGLTEGGRLSPLLWRLYISDLVRILQQAFPHLTIPVLSPLIALFIGFLLFVDDLCLIAHSTPSSFDSSSGPNSGVSRIA